MIMVKEKPKDDQASFLSKEDEYFAMQLVVKWASKRQTNDSANLG